MFGTTIMEQRKNVLDLETMSISGSLADGFALEPWRVRKGQAFIDSLHFLSAEGEEVMIRRPNKHQLITFLNKIKGLEVWCHNTVFDVAWLIASIEENKHATVPDCIRDVRWRDSLLLAKWLLNGQKADRVHYSYSLANIVSDACRDMPGVEEFVAFKGGAPMTADSAYWEKRGFLDCIWTQRVIEVMWPRLLPSQHCGFVIESACIPFVANSWLIGIDVNPDALRQFEGEIHQENEQLVGEIRSIIPSFGLSVVSSPKQMQNLLFNQLNLPVQKTTDSGAASTDVETLKLLLFELKANGHSHSTLMEKIMSLKNNATFMSKYVKTAWEAMDRTGERCMYPVPQMFGTISGRFTYSNTTGYRGPKVSIAAHQMPRRKKAGDLAERTRGYMIAPNDEYISEYDAAGQESRIMAMWSQDPVMIDIFQRNKNFHSMTASGVVGRAYEDFQADVDAEISEAIEVRQMGKLANLSCNFRIGAPALSRQTFVKYDMVIPIPTSYQLINTFKRLYRGVPSYWQRAIEFARSSGYTTTAADRRYKIEDWSRAWSAEQTAVSHPIQGTGADHKLIALATVSKKIPEAKFVLDLHDASFFVVPNQECHREIGRVLNSIEYGPAWCNVNCNVPLPFEGKFGKSFKDVK
jgi:DNA polymerase I-like protein with 3'-5' exonuclease and polymerase domains